MTARRTGSGLRAYLAGPDVFVADPVTRGDALKAICAAHFLTGVFPLDPLPDEAASWPPLPEWRRIALRNEAHIRSCALMIANLTPFRGPNADPGTALEIGIMRALGRPVWGWTNCAETLQERTGGVTDGEGMAIESFGCVDNLMIDGAIAASGGRIVTAAVAPAERWTDLRAFTRCVALAAAWATRGQEQEPR